MAEHPRRTVTGRLKDRFKDKFRGRFTCACSPGRDFRTLRAFNAHHMARHGGYWAGKAGKAMRNKIGKERDAARRHARGWLEASGLVDAQGRRTERWHSRPKLRGRLKLGDLRGAERHDRHHERAGKHDRKADQARARGKPEQARRHQHRADWLRSIYGTPSREAQERAARQRAQTPAPARDRTGLAGLNGRSNGRNGHSNGTRPVPQRTGRTR